MSRPASVRVDAVTYTYPGRDAPVLDGATLAIEPGERVAILGPNGSGKTTLMLHLNGLLTAQHGSIAIDEVPLTADTVTDIRRRVALVFQDPNDQLFMHSVHDDVAFGPANLGLTAAERDRRVADALEAVAATKLSDRAPHHLSGGEKRRVALATVLAMDPDVLVLDEPTSGLDPVGRHELADLLATLPQTQIVVTHDLPFALATCPRCLVLNAGRVVVDIDTEALLRNGDLLAAHRLALPYGYRV